VEKSPEAVKTVTAACTLPIKDVKKQQKQMQNLARIIMI
jgi:hypothetical protein